MTLTHRIAHWFGWNGGHVETWREDDGVLMVGFRCVGCGRLGGVAPVPARIEFPERFEVRRRPEGVKR